MSKSLPRVKDVTITIFEDGKEKKQSIRVQKAGLGKWKLIIDSLKKVENLLPEIIKRKGYDDPNKFLENLTPIALAGLIPEVFGFAVEEIIEVLTVGTDADREFIEDHVGPDEAVELFVALIEVNNLYKVAEVGKQLPFLKGMVNNTTKTKSLTK